MSKRKEKTLAEVRRAIGLQMQDRRNFLNTLTNIENFEKSIELLNRHLKHMKVQLGSKSIEERDSFGNILTSEQLERKIEQFEFEQKKMELNLDFAKEDLYFVLNVNEGCVQKAGSLENLKDQVRTHYALMREEYEKTKKTIGG